MLQHLKQVQKHIAADEGATVIEYAVLVALIIAACIAVIFLLGGQIRDGFQMFSEELAAALAGTS